MTYKYVSLCHKSRDFSSSFALLPIADQPPKLEVIFCVQAVITDPCGVPSSVSNHRPSSITPAFSHFWIRRTTRWSPIRCSTNLIIQSCPILSKNDLMSKSSTQFTFFCVIPTYSASTAPRNQRGPLLAALRPEPVRKTQKVLFPDLVENCPYRSLGDFVFQ